MYNFEKCATLDELKREYHKAAVSLHPDMGGTTEDMQRLNAEYEIYFNRLKTCRNAAAAGDSTGSTTATMENAEDFIAIIDHLLRMPGLTVELCGRWLWIGGETRAHKDELKACGCRWSSNKKLWSWHFSEDGSKWRKTHYSMDRIRSKYGSTKYTRATADALHS